MKIKNSLSTFLEQAQIVTNNGLETIDKIGSAMASSEDTVKLILTDPNDSSKSIEYLIPSFGYLKSEIDRLSASLKTMSNVTDGAGSRIRLSDGSYRKIIASKIPSEAPTITSVDNITNFNFKANWFFEDMLNPCLYVTWDMSNQISPDTERVMIQRYILKCDTQNKKDVFDEKLKGRNDIDYKDFLNILVNNRIKYTLDDEIKDLPPRTKRYYGTFSVIRIAEETDLNGRKVKRYILDSLEFTDNRSGFENTRILSVGDYVDINTIPTSTRYKVIFVDVAENKIGLKCVEGCEGVRIGVDVLKISSSQDTAVSADIPVGFDEREVIFVKAIDPDSNIPSSKWSPGVAFYSNELTYVDGNGSTQTLQRFYQKNVVDFGQVLLSYANDYYPSIREGIVPDPPVLNYANGEGDFKIVQINAQLTEATDAATFRNLISDKAKVQSELHNVTAEISKQKELIQTTQYSSTNEKLKAQSTLSTLVTQQANLTSNYSSLVNNIKSKYESSIVSAPKYRVRGFWDMPDSKMSPSSGEQKIIQFKIRYRYLSESGNSNKEEEFNYSSGNTSVIGRFSNWNEIETKLRPRVKTNTGWEWEDINTSDPDAVNINQLDIPINPGEQVEIQVKSVSEAGYPSNPLESVWSDPITVSFSDFAELLADNVSELIEQNKVDAAVANIIKMFEGTTAHMSSSFYTNDKYFAHTAESITSGFLSPEQTPITLYDKLQDLQNQLTLMMELIKGTVGDVDVVLTDNSDEQKIYNLNEGGTTYINAGNYIDDIASLENKNGAIVTKTFYLDISTDAQSGLFLLSKLSGDRLAMCPSTIKDDNGEFVTSQFSNRSNDYSNYDNVLMHSTSSSKYYMEQGRYDLVPINLTNPEVIDFQVGSPSMYQSAQCRGQFVYSRFRNIGDTFDMYANTISSSEDGGFPTFDYRADFTDAEILLDDKDNIGNLYFGKDSDRIKNIKKYYNDLTGSEVDENIIKNNLNDIMSVINRLPKTWSKNDSITTKNYGNKKFLLRVDKLNDLDSGFALDDEKFEFITSQSSGTNGGSGRMMSRAATQDVKYKEFTPVMITKSSDLTYIDFEYVVRLDDNCEHTGGSYIQITHGGVGGVVYFKKGQDTYIEDAMGNNPYYLDEYSSLGYPENLIIRVYINDKSSWDSELDDYDFVLSIAYKTEETDVPSTPDSEDPETPSTPDNGSGSTSSSTDDTSVQEGTIKVYLINNYNPITTIQDNAYVFEYPLGYEIDESSIKFHIDYNDRYVSGALWISDIPNSGQNRVPDILTQEKIPYECSLSNLKCTVGNKTTLYLHLGGSNGVTKQEIESTKTPSGKLPNVYLTASLKWVGVQDNDDSDVETGGNTSSGGSLLNGIFKLGKRVKTLTGVNSTMYTIVPKIQATFGYADLGSMILPNSIDREYYTTHKIGYEDKDRYTMGPETCSSYLFLSPVTHKEIQVDGDALDSGVKIKSGESIRVPIIYQYRMTDYSGKIFGDENFNENDVVVKNAKFANIIGIDIWTDKNALKPRQFDIIVYSTYNGLIETNNNRTKTSTQKLINVGTEIANKIGRLKNDSKGIVSNTNIVTSK